LVVLVVDSVVLTAGVLAVYALDRSSQAHPLVFALVPEKDLALLLVSVGAACAAMIAIMAAVIDRLSTDRRAVWICAAFTLYGVVAVPAATLSSTSDRSDTVIEATRFAAHVGAAVLMAIAVWGPRRPNVGQVIVCASGLVGAGLAALFAWVAPGVAAHVVGSSSVRVAFGIGSVAIGVALLGIGMVERSPQLTRVGIAGLALAAAHVYRVVDGQTGMSLPFAAARLLALAMALWGLTQLTRQTLSRVQDGESRGRDELVKARKGLARAEKQNHELRARLARLSGVAELLGESGGEALELRSAVRSELLRLESMLVAQDGAPHRPPTTVYPVGPMVQDVVTLRRCSGMDVRCDIDGEPWADGSSNVLKQVLVNLLANCARHAPLSPVRVQVSQRGDRVRLRVTDFGPGVPSGMEDAVFDRGTRSAAGGGQGLGLHICRELLAADGAKIEIRPPSSLRAGCTVIVEVPKARKWAGRTTAVARAV
jgi:two-component system OmpR family sensor kinase